MKLLTSILLVAAIIFAVQGRTREEMRAKWEKLAAECKNLPGVSEDEMEGIMNHAKPTTHEGKCVVACILEHMGVVVDGKVNKEGLEEWQKQSSVPADVIQTAITECEGISDSDPCEAATEIGHCFKDTLKKSGLFPED